MGLGECHDDDHTHTGDDHSHGDVMAASDSPSSAAIRGVVAALAISTGYTIFA